jgi:hypothetical protein
MRESWSTRWYTPLLVLGGALLVLLFLALAIVEMLTAAVPTTVAPRAWTTPLEQADAARRAGDTRAALAWWREAHAAALRSRQWEGMIEVGDAARRFDADAGRARQAYLTALFRARRQRSLDGVLSAATAFGELGDRDVLTQALHIAEREASPDPRDRARVRSAADRWTPAPVTSRRRDSPFTGGQQP